MYLISFKNSTIYKPYAIFIDHQIKSIIITIKGTSSKDDVITDFNCDPMRVTIIAIIILIIIIIIITKYNSYDIIKLNNEVVFSTFIIISFNLYNNQ